MHEQMKSCKTGDKLKKKNNQANIKYYAMLINAITLPISLFVHNYATVTLVA